MAIFYYKAKNSNAETISGKIAASDREDAVEKISSLDLVPVVVTDRDFSSSRADKLVRFGRVRLRDLYFFSRQFSNLLKTGVSILRALDVLSRQTRNLYFKQLLTKVRLEVQGGKSFSESIAAYPRVFPPVFISMTRAGEEGGRLHQVIAKLGEYLSAQLEIRSKVKTALIYPAMMLVCGIGAVTFILTSVMPKITRVFIDTRQSLPAPTIFVMGLSDFLIHYWAWILIVILVVVFLIKQWIKTRAGRLFLDDLSLRIPVLKDMWLKEDLARFSRTMALLLETGVPIVTAMRLSVPAVSNSFVQQQLMKCQEELIAGRSFGEQIKRMSLIPDIMGDLIAVGEESGSLVMSFSDIADNYEQEINDDVKIMTTLFEPIMIVIIGALIGFVVIAMLLPIFQMDIFS